MNGRRVLLAVALLPMGAAAFAKWQPPQSASVTVTEKTAPLAFDQYLVNRRRDPVQPTMDGYYRFTNVGDVPLTINKLKPSCGCLQPQLANDKKTYQPGERGTFRVQVATANEEPGPHEYEVKVSYTADKPRETTVRFKLMLPVRKLTVDPPELAFFQYNGEPSSRVVHVTDYRDTALEVVKVTSTSEFVTAEVQLIETDDGGHRRVPVKLSVPGVVPPGRNLTTVTIHTNDPEYAVIRIPVLIDGPQSIQLIDYESPQSDTTAEEINAVGPAPE